MTWVDGYRPPVGPVHLHHLFNRQPPVVIYYKSDFFFYHRSDCIQLGYGPFWRCSTVFLIIVVLPTHVCTSCTPIIPGLWMELWFWVWNPMFAVGSWMRCVWSHCKSRWIKKKVSVNTTLEFTWLLLLVCRVWVPARSLCECLSLLTSRPAAEHHLKGRSGTPPACMLCL